MSKLSILMISWAILVFPGSALAESSCVPDVIHHDRFEAFVTMPGLTPFSEQAQERGLIYPMQDHPASYGFLGYGTAFADLNGNGHQDVVLIGAEDNSVGVFENDGSGHFIDRSESAGIPDLPQGSGLAVGDYNGNGLPDIYFTNFGLPDMLIRNDGDFEFSNVTKQAGLGSWGRGKGASWGDFNGNGWLDLYVTNYTDGVGPGGDIPSTLYLNNGDGTFTNVSESLGVADDGAGFEALWFDMNRNGWLDLYLINDRGHFPAWNANRLWRNDKGHLTDISEDSGAGIGLDSMGIGAGDFNRNGYTDLYITNIPGQGGFENPLLINQGDETFVEQSHKYGVNNPYLSWGALMVDLTNNGFLDLYVNNQEHDEPNTLYLNTGEKPLPEMGQPMQVTGRLTPNSRSYSTAYADINGNGGIDMLVNDLGGNVLLYVNREGLKRNWIRFRMIGEYPNHHAIGGNVDVLVNDTWHFEEIYGSGHGYLGQNELILHVGAGSAPCVDEIVARWPSQGPTRTLKNYPINELWDIFPPSRLGDVSGDGSVEFSDLMHLSKCYGQPVKPGCEIMDFSGNGHVEKHDAIQFFNRYGGELTDCNGSGKWDQLEILLEPSLDQSGDWQIDACQGGQRDIGSGDRLAKFRIDHTPMTEFFRKP